MSDRGTEALEAEQAVEAKLAEAGADNIRRPFQQPEVPAPDEGTPEAPRNELGQFTATTDPDAPTEPTDSPAAELVAADEVAASPAGDPAVQAFLAKYGGDVNKALEGAVHLQRKAGEQSNEVGDLRRMVDELTSLRETIQQNQVPQQQFVDQATVDWYDEQVMANPQGALEWARQQNNPLLVQRGLSVWKEIDPYGAADYNSTLKMQALAEQVQQQMSQQARLPLDATVNLALQNVRSRNPHFANYDDQLEQTLARHEFAASAWRQATASGDPAQIEGAIETLYSLAVGDTLQQIAQTPTGVDTTTTQDVVTPSVSETRDQTPEPSALDKFKEEFRQEAERAKLGAFHVAN